MADADGLRRTTKFLPREIVTSPPSSFVGVDHAKPSRNPLVGGSVVCASFPSCAVLLSLSRSPLDHAKRNELGEGKEGRNVSNVCECVLGFE